MIIRRIGVEQWIAERLADVRKTRGLRLARN